MATYLTYKTNWDESSFQQVYNDYYSIMALYAFKHVRNQEEAEDIVQDVFADLWARKVAFHSHKALLRYLYVCIHNKCVDVMRRANIAKLTDMEPAFVNIEDPDFEAAIMSHETYPAMRMHIDMLPDRQRMTIQLVMNGLSNAEIAEKMNVTVNTVKNQKFKAFTTLRKRFA